MPEFVYGAWFRDEKFPADDQDGEWVAMWIVVGDTPAETIAWGDRIAKRHAAAVGEPFVRSYVEHPSAYASRDGVDRLSRVRVGDDSADPFTASGNVRE